MTEFEMATLAVQRMGVLVAALVGFSQCALIGGGLFMMRRAAIMRDRALDELSRGTRTNHEESMAAIQADREQNMGNHRETMEKQEKSHREAMAEIKANREQNMENHREAMAALHELIRRTSKAEE